MPAVRMGVSVSSLKRSAMGRLTAQMDLMSPNGRAAHTVMRWVLSHVLASLDPVPKCVTVLPHVLTNGMSRSPPVSSIIPPVLGIHVRMAVGVYLFSSFVTQG